MTHAKIFDYLDPVLLSIAGFEIKWYAIAYILGILLGGAYANYFSKKFHLNITKNHIDDFMIWLICGIIIGGRLGYVIFYNPLDYLHDPIEIFNIRAGGLSFYGGGVGVLISTYIFSKRNKISFLTLYDLIASSVPIGIFFGRCANFVNIELVGRVTYSNFGIIFPGYINPRHPSQLYEAFFEGIILFIILFVASMKYNSLKKPGLNFGIATFFYSLFRIFIEFFREPDIQLGFIISSFSMGQIQSLPFLFIGIMVIYTCLKKKDS